MHEYRLKYGTKSASACFLGYSLLGYLRKSIVLNLKLNIIITEELLILLYESVLGLSQYSYKLSFIKLLQYRYNRQSADKFRNHTKFYKILRYDLLEDIVHFFLVRLNLASKAYRSLSDTFLDLFFQSIERTAADKQDILCVYLDHFLVRMLSSALRRNIGYCSFNYLEKSL